MKNKNKFIQLKKFDFLENLTNEGLISQLIVFYGDAIDIIREATETGTVDAKGAVAVIMDMILVTAKLDINLKRKARAWWNGKMNESFVNLPDNQRIFLSGLHLLSKNDPTKVDIDTGIKSLQESIEIMAYSFNLDTFKLVEDLSKNYGAAENLIETEYSPKGIFVMDLVNVLKYKGIQIDNANFDTGVVPMDFFKASIHAVNTDRDFGVKISEELKTYIDELDNFFMIKFFNHDNVEDNDFYTLKTEGSGNRLFRGDEDITDSVTEERDGVTIIPFTNYSMVLVTPEMEKLDDLLDYYNKYK